MDESQSKRLTTSSFELLAYGCLLHFFTEYDVSNFHTVTSITEAVNSDLQPNMQGRNVGGSWVVDSTQKAENRIKWWSKRMVVNENITARAGVGNCKDVGQSPPHHKITTDLFDLLPCNNLSQPLR